MQMQTVENPAIPFHYPIGNGLQTGSEIILSGATYNGQQKRFEVNLNGDGDNVVLHVNPRFKFLEDTIVLNNRTYTGWQKEERHRNRISIGDSFRLRIVCHHSHFLIFVNDKEIAQFEHRLSPQMVRSLEVSGDVVLHRVNLVNLTPPQTAYAPQYQMGPPQPQYVPSPSFQQPPQPGFAYPAPAPGYPLSMEPKPNAYPPSLAPQWGPESSQPQPNAPYPRYPGFQ